MVWTCTEEGRTIYGKKDAQDGATRYEAKTRFMDVVREDLQIVCMREENAEHGER